MPKKGYDNEPLLGRAMYAYDGSFWKPLLIDSNQYLKVTLPITEGIEARMHGWVNNGWRNNPILPGYSRIFSERIYEISPTTGTRYLSGTTVPNGEIWNLQNIAASNGTRSALYILFTITSAGTLCVFSQEWNVAAAHWVSHNVNFILQANDYVRCYFAGTQAGDLIDMRYSVVVSNIND